MELIVIIECDDTSQAMTADTAAPPPLSAHAITAFLRGVERRAAVFAELQCGLPSRGDAAVAAALRAFPRIAPTTPMADWPVRFWSLLLAAPDLRRTEGDACWDTVWSPLASLGNGPRAALLLRLVAALEMDAAAAALGVSADSYRAALQRAIPYCDDDTPDRERWQAWVAEVRARVEGMSGERLAALHGPTVPTRESVQAAEAASISSFLRTRESTDDGEAAPISSFPRMRESTDHRDVVVSRLRGNDGPPRRKRRTFAIAAIALAVAAAATIGGIAYLRPQWFDRIPGRGIHTRNLPPADEPAARYDAELAAWTHRDFLAIADVDGLQRAQDFAFFAWYAATLAVQPAQDAAMPAPASTVAAVPAGVLAEPVPPLLPPPRATPLQAPLEVVLPASTASAIARVPATLQGDLRAQASLWTSWSPAERADFLRRAAQWEAQPLHARAQQRIRYAAWRNLDAVSAEAVENAVQLFARQPSTEQARLRAEFDALDPMSQRGWLLGPAIGADYPKLQPLLAQLPEAQHAPMLRLLREMSAAERADLDVLAQRVPPQEREALVRDVLSTSEVNRAAWLRTRLDQ
jgi:hypothetical protein